MIILIIKMMTTNNNNNNNNINDDDDDDDDGGLKPSSSKIIKDSKSQNADTGPTSPSANPFALFAWQGSHWRTNS